MISETHLHTPLTSRKPDPLKSAAERLEATFLAEMLKYSGLHKSGENGLASAGEDQWASFLIQAQADKIASSGGVGLAEAFYKIMMEKANDSVAQDQAE